MLDRPDRSARDGKCAEDAAAPDRSAGERDTQEVGRRPDGEGRDTGVRSDTEARSDQRPDASPQDDRAAPDQASSRPDGDAAADSEQDGKRTGGGVWHWIRAHRLITLAIILVLAAAIVGGVLWYLEARHFESTDDAFVDTHSVSISPEVTGNIVAIPVTDNQVVKAGDLLAQIDDRDYRAQVDQAAAQIEQAEASIDNVTAQIKAQQAQVDQAAKQVVEAQAALNFSRDENTRYQELARTGYGTVQRAQQTASDLQAKQAALAAAEAAQTAAERQIKALKAQRRTADAQKTQAEAQKAQADANLSRTQLHATIDGRIARLTAALGQVATAGQALMVLVPLDVWVTANFKETQLADMRPGQPVTISIDAYGRSFDGHVDSIQAGSGAAFSLLPAENATGNYVKVVQRVPVKIVFDQRPDVELGPGLSVVPSVKVR